MEKKSLIRSEMKANNIFLNERQIVLRLFTLEIRKNWYILIATFLYSMPRILELNYFVRIASNKRIGFLEYFIILYDIKSNYTKGVLFMRLKYAVLVTRM